MYPANSSNTIVFPVIVKPPNQGGSCFGYIHVYIPGEAYYKLHPHSLLRCLTAKGPICFLAKN